MKGRANKQSYISETNDRHDTHWGFKASVWRSTRGCGSCCLTSSQIQVFCLICPSLTLSFSSSVSQSPVVSLILARQDPSTTDQTFKHLDCTTTHGAPISRYMVGQLDRNQMKRRSNHCKLIKKVTLNIMTMIADQMICLLIISKYLLTYAEN